MPPGLIAFHLTSHLELQILKSLNEFNIITLYFNLVVPMPRPAIIDSSDINAFPIVERTGVMVSMKMGLKAHWQFVLLMARS